MKTRVERFRKRYEQLHKIALMIRAKQEQEFQKSLWRDYYNWLRHPNYTI